MPVRATDISFVIQGPLRDETEISIEAIRRWYPGAEIVVSTWPRQTPRGAVDVLVHNEDPGEVRWEDHRNTNRQIVSTRNGLMTASRRYAVKIRSDCVIAGDALTRLEIAALPRNARYAAFRERVVCGTLFTRNPDRWALLFHPSDMFQFGLRADLFRLWSAPRAERMVVDGQLRMNAPFFFTPEQYVFRNYLQTAGFATPSPTTKEDPDPAHIEMSNGYLTQNFWVEAEEDLGISYPARALSGWSRSEDNFTAGEWREVARRYVEPKQA